MGSDLVSYTHYASLASYDTSRPSSLDDVACDCDQRGSDLIYALCPSQRRKQRQKEDEWQHEGQESWEGVGTIQLLITGRPACRSFRYIHIATSRPIGTPNGLEMNPSATLTQTHEARGGRDSATTLAMA